MEDFVSRFTPPPAPCGTVSRRALRPVPYMFYCRDMRIDRLNRLALRVLEDAVARAACGDVERTIGHRLALEFLVQAGIAERWQAATFWDDLAWQSDRHNFDHNVTYMQSTSLRSGVHAWAQRMGLRPLDPVQEARLEYRYAPELEFGSGTQQLPCMCNHVSLTGNQDREFGAISCYSLLMESSSDLAPSSIEPTDRIFIFKESERPEGGKPRTFAFTEAIVQPLGYDDLKTAEIHKPVTIHLEIIDAKIVESDVSGVELNNRVRFITEIETPFAASAIGLVRGGWLPPPLAALRKSTVILPDSDIISKVKGRFVGGQLKGYDPDFIDMFENEPVRINPLLAVLECNKKRFPNSHEIEKKFDEVLRHLTSALPEARLMVGPESLNGIRGLIADTQPAMERKIALVKHFASVLGPQVAKKDRDKRWSEVIAVADGLAVSRESLVVLALLSLVVNPGKTPARKVLKLGANYNDEVAYNALSDLRALELLIYLFACFPEEDAQLCTADKNLALFWVGIGASEFKRRSKGVSCSMTPHCAILPEPYAERWKNEISSLPDEA